MRRWSWTRLGGWMLMIAVACALLGCDDQGQSSSSPPPRRTPKKAAVPKADQQAQGQVGEKKSPAPPQYVYHATGKRDPFENPLQEFQAPVISREPLTPLQKFDLDQLRLVGVILGKGQPTAMVIAPGGKSFILKNGVKIGKNNGVVVGISAAGVKVEERYYDFTGEVRTNIQELRLPQRGRS